MRCTGKAAQTQINSLPQSVRRSLSPISLTFHGSMPITRSQVSDEALLKSYNHMPRPM